MKANMVQKSGNEYQMGEWAPFTIPARGLKRRADLDGLVHNVGAEGGANPYGRVYEDAEGVLLVRIA